MMIVVWRAGVIARVVVTWDSWTSVANQNDLQKVRRILVKVTFNILVQCCWGSTQVHHDRPLPRPWVFGQVTVSFCHHCWLNHFKHNNATQLLFFGNFLLSQTPPCQKATHTPLARHIGPGWSEPGNDTERTEDSFPRGRRGGSRRVPVRACQASHFLRPASSQLVRWAQGMRKITRVPSPTCWHRYGLLPRQCQLLNARTEKFQKLHKIELIFQFLLRKFQKGTPGDKSYSSALEPITLRLERKNFLL